MKPLWTVTNAKSTATRNWYEWPQMKNADQATAHIATLTERATTVCDVDRLRRPCSLIKESSEAKSLSGRVRSGTVVTPRGVGISTFISLHSREGWDGRGMDDPSRDTPTK
jgi:hypothetical protein